MTLAEKLKELFVNHDKNEEMLYEKLCYKEELADLGVESFVVDYYGGEDQGSDYYAVWKFSTESETCYFKFQGWYASYHGADFQEVFEVKPQTKTVLVYE